MINRKKKTELSTYNNTQREKSTEKIIINMMNTFVSIFLDFRKGNIEFEHVVDFFNYNNIEK